MAKLGNQLDINASKEWISWRLSEEKRHLSRINVSEHKRNHENA